MPQLQGRFIVAKMTRYQLSKLSHSRLFSKENGLLSAANVENTRHNEDAYKYKLHFLDSTNPMKIQKADARSEKWPSNGENAVYMNSK